MVDVDTDAGVDHSDPGARIPLEGRSAIDDVGRSRQGLQQELDTVFAVGVDCPSESDAFGLGQLGSLPQNLCENGRLLLVVLCELFGMSYRCNNYDVVKYM